MEQKRRAPQARKSAEKNAGRRRPGKPQKKLPAGKTRRSGLRLRRTHLLRGYAGRGPALTCEVCGAAYGLLYRTIGISAIFLVVLPLTRYSQNLVYEMRRTATVKPWNWNTASPASEST